MKPGMLCIVLPQFSLGLPPDGGHNAASASYCPQAGLSRHQLGLRQWPASLPASPLFPPLAHCPTLPRPSANPVVRRRGAALCTTTGQVRGWVRAGTRSLDKGQL